jgi:glutamate 5-kinase
VTGSFGRGDAVSIKNMDGKTVGKGLSEYSSTDAVKIVGVKTGEIESILGFKYRDTLIHRDDMVLEDSRKEKDES